ncbi:chemotaxis protein CheW [Ectothiorhodospiraceae bacterium BW-2]|nr:chemotaxis protein CheW [Ectothiorhodospiraceae bacterium BW-2]
MNYFISKMPEVEAYRASLTTLSERWNLLTLLGQMSNIGMDMTETRKGFQSLTDRLLERLTNETLNKLTSEMEAKAQVAVDIVIRNLFERTADIGFLATDDDIRAFIQEMRGSHLDQNRKQTLLSKITNRFNEYVSKYSVYHNIVLLSKEGTLLAQLDHNNPLTHSEDPLLDEAVRTPLDYVEVYRYSDISPNQGRALIYAYRVTESNDAGSPVLGVLCLLFRFENEMKGVFNNLLDEEDWAEITLLNSDGEVIASSDPYHIPCGCSLPKVLDKPYQIIHFAGREYLAKTCATRGYEGFTGLGWFGHVMVPLDSAFRVSVNQTQKQINSVMMKKVVSASTLFADDLVDIPRQADRIQRDLDVTVWNGNVQIANTKTGDNSFSKSLLNEISHTGAKTKQVFEESIANLNQTVISSFLEDAEFHAMLAVDIMDRNLYERANDCRWWALTSRFRQILAAGELHPSEVATITNILSYINNLYTVYTNLIVYDRNGKIVAVSNSAEAQLVGTSLSVSWVSETLSLTNSQHYTVSPFKPSHLYNDKYTYIYGAAITDIKEGRTVGGIAIVFDSEPQFYAMLSDALPKDGRGEVIRGCYGIFADRHKSVIATTNSDYPIGSILKLDDRFFTLNSGESLSDIVEIEGGYYVVGAQMSAGYREYKTSDIYKNDVVALIFFSIGEVSQSQTPNQQEGTPYNIKTSFLYPKLHGGEETVEISTFLVNQRLYGIESHSIICSINGQEVTKVMGTASHYLGLISFMKQTIPVVSLRALVGGDNKYDKECDSIVVTKFQDDYHNVELIGLVVDRVMDSPEIPVRSLSVYEKMMRSKEGLVQYIVQPDMGYERQEMLSILNVKGIYRAIFEPNLIQPALQRLEQPVIPAKKVTFKKQ